VSQLKTSENGVLVGIRVTASAKRNSVEYTDGVLKVKVTAPAEKGKANKAVVKLLKPVFGDCEIIAGHKSRRKTIIIRNRVKTAVEDVLTGLVGD